MKHKVLITLVLCIMICSGSGINLYSQNKDQIPEKQNPLKPGTDLEFDRLFNLALKYKDTGKEKEYEENMQKAYNRSEEINNDLLKSISLCFLGIIKIRDNKISEAEEIINKIKIISAKKDAIEETGYWRDLLLTEYCIKNSNYNEALKYCGNSLKGIAGIYGNYNRFTIEMYQNMGDVHYYIGDYGKFIEYSELSLKYADELFHGKHELIATSYNNLGAVYDSKGDYDRAIGYYEKSLAIVLELLGDKHPDTAASYNNLGAVYDSKGDYDRAIGYYEKSLAIYLEVQGDKHPGVAANYNNLGLAYRKKRDYDRAITYYEKSLKISLEVLGDKHPDIAAGYNNLGGAYDSKGDYDRAIYYYEKSLKITLPVLGENHADTATGYNNLGAAYDSKGDYDRAISYYEKSLKIRLALFGENHTHTAGTYNNLGLTFYRKKEYNRAILYFEKALVINKYTRSDQETMIISQNLGYIYNRTKQYKESFNSFLTGIETVEKVRKLNLSGGTDFTSRNINSYYCGVNAGFLQNDLNAMFNISERMRAMGYIERLSLKAAMDSAGIDIEQSSRLLKLKDDIERLSTLRQNLISVPLSSMNEQQKKEHDYQLEKVSNELAQAEAGFIKLDTGFMKNEKYKLLRDTSVVSAADAKKLCGKDGAVIEYIIPEKPDNDMKPYAIIITGSSLQAIELDSAYDFSDQIRKYRKAIKDSNKIESDQLGAELYTKLIYPAERFINYAEIKKLTIVPDGSLAFLPFDSIKTREKKYLSERYELSLTPSVTVSSMIKKRKYEKKDNLMAFGGGLYSSTGESSTRGESSVRGIAVEDAQKEKLAAKAYNSPLEYYNAQKLGWSDLPGTEREVSAINEKISDKKNSDVYTGAEVSEENLKSLSTSGVLKKYSSIHLACHGYYDPEYPGYSAVVFSEVSGKVKGSRDDGYMSVEETALLNMQSDIVILSACETGLGRLVSGDGVIGLTRAFQVAGSNKVLVTLWPVSDDATEEFMVLFYGKVRVGMSYSEALVKVKDEFRRSANYGAPYFWAGFVLYE